MSIDEAWTRALELAWEAFCAATTPVGAVVVDASRVIVAEGRGRRYEQAGPPGQLAGSHVAHAEINALARRTPRARWNDLKPHVDSAAFKRTESRVSCRAAPGPCS
jgi:tRNA(Arg) A34 adenosine deaminase TadA